MEVEAKESALFVNDERPEQIFVDITEEVEASSERENSLMLMMMIMRIMMKALKMKTMTDCYV